MNTIEHPSLLTPRQLAARWGMSEKTLERWRTLGTGPMYLKLGSRVMYPLASIAQHEQGRMRRCTAGQELSQFQPC